MIVKINTVTAAFLLLTGLDHSIGFLMLKTPNDECRNNYETIQFKVDKSSDCVTMKGTETGSLACEMCLFEVSEIERTEFDEVWGIDKNQTPARAQEGIVGGFKMPRSECDKLGGTYTGYPYANTPTNCKLSMKRITSSYKNVSSPVICGIDECDDKMADMVISTPHRNCLRIGGESSNSRYPNSYYDCKVHLSRSPVISCIASDKWSSLQTCINHSDVDFECVIERKTGVSKGTSSSSTKGGNVGASISAKASVQLAQIFTAEVSTELTTGFKWENTEGRTELWNEETTNTYKVILPPGKSVVVEQIVGRCGNYHVKTTEFRLRNYED